MGWRETVNEYLSRLLVGGAQQGAPKPPPPPEVAARERRFSPLWEAFYGRYPSPRGVKKKQKPVIVNYVRLVVYKAADALFGHPFRVETGSRALDADVEAWLEAQGGLTLWHSVAVTGAITGLAAVWVGPDGSLGEVDTTYLEIVPEPRDYRAFTEARLYLENRTRKVLRRADEGEGWVVITERMVSGVPRWEAVGEPEPWPWPFPPLVYCQNLPAPHEVWGISEAEVVYSLNLALNSLLTHAEVVAHRFASPRLVGFGFRRETVQMISEESMLVIPEKNADIKTVDPRPDLASILALANQIRATVMEVAQTPDIALGRVEGLNLGGLSGVALRVLYQPMIDKLAAKRRLYGRLVTEAIRRAMVVTGKAGPDQVYRIAWPDILPENVLESRQAAIMEQQLGVSAYTILRRLGYDPEQEAALREAGATDMAERLLRAFDAGVE